MDRRYETQESRDSKEKRAKERQYFTTTRVKYIDYKDINILEQFIDTHARIQPKRKTHISARNQRLLSQAIKRARFMALLPFVAE
ncbi:MAG: 30S ribosomal protein S18 [Candidatus Paceibacterota bacterium]